MAEELDLAWARAALADARVSSRRRVARRAAGWPGQCRFGADGDWVECRILDVSMLGAAVEPHGPIPAVGTIAVTVAPMRDDHEVVLSGVVTDVRPDVHEAPVVGMAFDELSADQSV